TYCPNHCRNSVQARSTGCQFLLQRNAGTESYSQLRLDHCLPAHNICPGCQRAYNPAACPRCHHLRETGQWKTLIVDTLRKVPPPPAPMLITLDGIDECESHDEQRVLLEAILSTADQLGPHFKLLIASRPERQVQRVLEDFANIRNIELGNTDQDSADIGLFLQTSLQEIHCSYERHGTPTAVPGAWPRNEDVQKLVKKASGQFIYASLVVQFVKNYHGDPSVPLELVLKPHSKSFKELDNLYLIVMEKIEKSTHKKHRPLLHYLMVCVLMDLVYPYNSDLSLFCPKALDKSTVKILLASLHPVVDSNGRFRHITFCNFLTQPANPHPFSITSRHISRLTSRSLRSLAKAEHSLWVKEKSLFCLLHSSPTPRLIFRLAFLPRSVFEGSELILANDQILWHTTLSRLLLSWLRVWVSNYDLPVLVFRQLTGLWNLCHFSFLDPASALKSTQPLNGGLPIVGKFPYSWQLDYLTTH
ncbi:hypothetical protein BDN72DRAFT_944107, partial [Pluteus cervinus]